jgi:hypothetical protein
VNFFLIRLDNIFQKKKEEKRKHSEFDCDAQMQDFRFKKRAITLKFQSLDYIDQKGRICLKT